MKKTISFGILAMGLSIMFIFSPVFVSAQTTPGLQAQIASLMAQIKALQAQIATLQAAQNGTAFCHNFNANLGIGSTGDEVNALLNVLGKEGVSGTTGSNGTFDETLASAVSSFQDKYKSEILTPAGLKYPTGYVGAMTRAKLNSIYGCAKVPVPPIYDGTPIISGVSGPQTLNVNQAGTWAVKASSSNGGNLSYSVVWGDEELGTSNSVISSVPQSQLNQSATFSHTYYYSGNFNPTFTVKNDSGQTAKTSLSVNVGGTINTAPVLSSLYPTSGQIGTQVTITGTGLSTSNTINGMGPSGNFQVSAYSYDGRTLIFSIPSLLSNTNWTGQPVVPGTYQIQVGNSGGSSNNLSFTVTTQNSSYVTVLSPNGGETWTKGTTQTINWNFYSDRCPVGGPCITSPTVVQMFDINLVSYVPPCTSNICPMMPTLAPRTIAKGVYGSSYLWTISSDLTDGSYTIQVCQSGTSVCDSSDSYFKIVTANTITNTSPKITISNVGTIPPVVGQSISFGWGATDADNDDLVWNVDWGDSAIGTGLMTCSAPGNAHIGSGQHWNYSTSHVWTTAGTYTVKVTVGDCHGGGDSSTFTVNVGNTINYDTFATCLKNKGAVLYGAFWCPHCQSQKAIFGTSASLLPYVECSTSDGAGQTQTCKDKNITSYPTWEFADLSRLMGELSLQQLADKTSCALPK